MTEKKQTCPFCSGKLLLTKVEDRLFRIRCEQQGCQLAFGAGTNESRAINDYLNDAEDIAAKAMSRIKKGCLS